MISCLRKFCTVRISMRTGGTGTILALSCAMHGFVICLFVAMGWVAMTPWVGCQGVPADILLGGVGQPNMRKVASDSQFT